MSYLLYRITLRRLHLKMDEVESTLLYLFIYIIHIAIYGIHVTKQVTLKIQLEY